MESEKLLTISDVMEMYQVNRNTVYRMIDDGRLPKPLKLGKSVRWRLKQLTDSLDQIQENQAK